MAFKSTNVNKTLTESLLNSSLATSQSFKKEIFSNLKNQISLDDDWIAVKSLSNNINNNISSLNKDILIKNNQHLINIVSISVEKEKVIFYI